ncbi:MAG: hypothetical protein E7525_04575 [Ruminococcaceae bacterium]|nr:hypothetical protein [Oscillospiraceae bacterium]
MFGIDILVQKVLLLTAMVFLGFILCKVRLADERLSKGFADIVIYVAQPAMIIYGFLEAEFTKTIVLTSLCVFVFAVLFHFGFYGIAGLMFRRVPTAQQKCLRYATVFTNTGFMGIPLISELISPTAAVYATFYVVAFNVFNWTLGCYIYTGDRKYMQAKKMFINPATVPTYVGLAIFVISGLVTLPDGIRPVFDSFLTPLVRDNILFLLKGTVVPLSMMMIGIRLADCQLKAMFKDKYMLLLFAVRLIAIPLLVIALMKLVIMTGIIPDSIAIPAATVLCISASTPVAALATVFAEKFQGDAVYASKLVSLSTVLSLVTMPLLAAILTKII